MSDARITRVGNVGVPTHDQDRALAFYEGTLGFQKVRDMPFGGGMRWIEVAPPGGDITIAILPTPPGNPVGVDTAIRLLTDDAGAANAGLKAAGANVGDVLNFGPGVPPMFTFQDSEGNTLYVVQA